MTFTEFMREHWGTIFTLSCYMMSYSIGRWHQQMADDERSHYREGGD